MTVKMLTAWNGYPKDYIGSVISPSEEARLVSINFASYDLDGVDNDNVRMPVTATTNPLTGGISFQAGANIPIAMRGDETRVFQGGQPFGITRPVISQGIMFSDFSGTRCTAVSAAATALTDYTGYDGSAIAQPVQSITGLPSMLKLVITSDATQQLQITNANLGNVTLNGTIGFWVYADMSAKVGGSGASIGFDLFNSTSWAANYTRCAFNGNQIRHGWNFLVYKQIKEVADMGTSGSPEIPFVGLSSYKSGTGANGDIKNNQLKYINIDITSGNNCTLYFDSMWTGFSSKAQFVIGCDQATNDTVAYALPKFQEKGWKGYFASPYRVWTSGTKLVSTWDNSPQSQSNSLIAAGWDCINHTVNHLPNGAITNPGEIRYEIEASTAWYLARGLTKGTEFYASPQSSTSLLAERIISECGIKLQRHSKRSNVQVTQFGVDNINHVGAIDMSNNTALFQKATLIKSWVDNIIAYGATGFPFWHSITTLGDTGTGEDLTGNDLTMTLSAFNIAMDYIAEKEAAGLCRVCDGVTGFYYGIGR